MDDDAIEFDLKITLREGPYIDPRPVLFVCAICEEQIRKPNWHADGRSRNIAPLCLSCEQVWGGMNASSWFGNRMDARIARQVNAAACFLQALANRKKGGRHVS